MRVATLTVGRYDGVDKHMVEGGEVLVDGRRHPLIGHVSLNHCVIDLLGREDVKIGDEVVLLGRQRDDEITVYEVAERSRRSCYDVLVDAGKRVEKIYLNG